jgi:hypothetical protein
MSSSRRLALLLALSFAAVPAALAESSSSSSNPAAAGPEAAQDQTQAGPTQGQLSVQARIRARRAQRRAAAIHENYDHLYDAYVGMGYLRFTPGSKLERAHEYAWTVGITRYINERLGVTAEGRGYYATAYTGIKLTDKSGTISNPYTNPAISEYTALTGPTYRFYLQPKYSVSGRVMGGFIRGNFSGDTNHDETISKDLGLWPDGNSFAVSASIPVEYNVTPRLAVRVAPEYFHTNFGSKQQNTLGFTTGIVVRFGKQ